MMAEPETNLASKFLERSWLTYFFTRILSLSSVLVWPLSN